MKNLLLIMLLAGVLGGCATMKPSKPVTLNLNAQNNSGQNGTVTLTPMGESTKVDIRVASGAPDVDQPAHIHGGTCANIDPKPKYPLNNVKNGVSTSTVPASLDSLMATPNALNIHKSTPEIKVYVACGDIPRK